MIRIFLDSSVLFSATFSAKGYSRDLLILAAREEIIIVISHLVVEETRRNLTEFAPEAVPYLERLIEAIPFEYVHPTKREVLSAAKHTALKDAPIIAAARKAQVEALVTLDKKHLLEKQDVAKYAGIKVITPKKAMGYIQKSI